MSEGCSVNVIADKLQVILTQAADSACTRKTTAKPFTNNKQIKRPWVDDECQHLRKLIVNTNSLDEAAALGKDYRKLKNKKKHKYKRSSRKHQPAL